VFRSMSDLSWTETAGGRKKEDFRTEVLFFI
jgi:hypothetical protein